MTAAKLAIKIPPIDGVTTGWYMAGFFGMAAAGLAGLQPAFLGLGILCFLDLLAGTWAAIKRREFRRQRFFEGGGDKLFIVLVVGSLELLGRLLGVRIPLFGLGSVSFGEAAAAWYGLREASSATANLARAGHRLPRWAESVVRKVTDKLDELPKGNWEPRRIEDWPLLRDRKKGD